MRYAITVIATATIRETWAIEADTPPTPEEASSMLSNGELVELVKEEVLGDEERDWSSVEVEELL